MFTSLSEGKFNKYRGVIYGTKKPNHLGKTFKFNLHEADMNFSMAVKIHSPLLAKLEIFKYGSNKLRKNLNHIHKLELSKTQVTEPIIKGKGFKSREQKKEKKRDNSQGEKGKIKRGSTILEGDYE
jgi:hypothetical protein